MLYVSGRERYDLAASGWPTVSHLLPLRCIRSTITAQTIRLVDTGRLSCEAHWRSQALRTGGVVPERDLLQPFGQVESTHGIL